MKYSNRTTSNNVTYTCNGVVDHGNNYNAHPKSGNGGMWFILLTGFAAIAWLAQFVF